MVCVHVRCVHTLQNCLVQQVQQDVSGMHRPRQFFNQCASREREWWKADDCLLRGCFLGARTPSLTAHSLQGTVRSWPVWLLTCCWLVPLVWNRHLWEKMCFTLLSECTQEPVGGQWLKHFHYLEVSSIRTLWFHKFTFFLTPLCPWQAPWKGVERGVQRKCTATKEGLKRSSLFLGFSCFFLPGDGAICQTRDKGGSMGGSWQWGRKGKLLGRSAADTRSRAFWRPFRAVGCRELAWNTPQIQEDSCRSVSGSAHSGGRCLLSYE